MKDGPAANYDVGAIRSQFPILAETVYGKPLVYLDNAATTQKPQGVIDTITGYYLHDNANIHRGVHLLSQRATDQYEAARESIRRFLNASDTKEIIYVRGATEGINLVAQTYGRRNIKAGDEIVISAMEHHSNIVPWQMLCEETGAVLRVAAITDAGELDLESFKSLLGPRTKFVSIVFMSNALGTINPVKEIVALAHATGAAILIDAAQAASHLKIDVQDLDCDFLVLSGHKIYGPTGIGVLYGKRALLEAMPPYQGGGDMISSVTFEKTVYNNLPHKFEAGTPHIDGGIGLGAAIAFVNAVGIDAIGAYEKTLLDYGTAKLAEMPCLRMIGTARHKASVLSFVMAGVHPHDIGTILDQEGVAIRTGHHCTQPIMHRFGIPATARASLACYNTMEDIDALIRALHTVVEILQ